MIIIISLAILIATLLGGMFAIKYGDKLHLVLGFSAGAVVSVALFELLPEAVELYKDKDLGVISGSDITNISTLIGIGFIIYLLIDRFMTLNSHPDHEHCENPHHKHTHEGLGKIQSRGVIAASSLAMHSLVDGLAIGLGFEIGTKIGIAIAVAVIFHDFSDGLNTVSVVLKNGATKMVAFIWLAIDSLAPILGIIIGTNIAIEEKTLGTILALFCGFFLYIGASELIPESHHNHPKKLTTILTILSMAFFWIIINKL